MAKLGRKLSDCELANTKLQQNCAELGTNLGEEIAILEGVKRKQLAEQEAVRRDLETELSSLQRCHAGAHEWTTGLSTEESSRDYERLV
ncbi:hypothetical protein TSMEX_007896 [Taenia solium]|eukprot:TsM_000938200 transcript=TsM_000938200 gene=TsM_000938200